jgi:hypothetical protein
MPTAIALIAFGFFVENLNLILLTTASTTSAEARIRYCWKGCRDPLGRYDGHAIISCGLGTHHDFPLRASSV